MPVRLEKCCGKKSKFPVNIKMINNILKETWKLEPVQNKQTFFDINISTHWVTKKYRNCKTFSKNEKTAKIYAFANFHFAYVSRRLVVIPLPCCQGSLYIYYPSLPIFADILLEPPLNGSRPGMPCTFLRNGHKAARSRTKGVRSSPLDF